VNRYAAAALALALVAGTAAAQDTPPPPPAAPEGVSAAAPAADASPIPWERDFAAAKEKAAKEKKGLLVYMTPDWFI